MDRVAFVSAAVAAVPTAAVVSALVDLLFKGYLTRKIEHDFAEKLETLKAELSLERDITLRKLDDYREIAELIHRTRNISRDIATNIGVAAVGALADELRLRFAELDRALYRVHILLQRDGAYESVHGYTRSIQEFHRLFREWAAAESEGRQHDAEEVASVLADQYRDIDLQYGSTSSLLAALL
jgi:hypothetical protein